MIARRLTPALILTFTLAACGQDAPPEVSSAPATATEGTTTQQAGSPSVAVQAPSTPTAAAPGAAAPGAAAPTAPPTAPGVAGPNGQRMNLAGLQRALAAATEASGNAAGDTDCERAYNGITAMVAAMRKATGRAGARTNAPGRERFMRACGELPPQIQQCMVISYGMEHQQQCQAARAQLTPEMQERMQQVMRGGDHAGADRDHGAAHPEATGHDRDDDEHEGNEREGNEHEGESH